MEKAEVQPKFDDIREDLLDVLEKAGTLDETKRSIINALPVSFLEEMHAHLLNTDIEREAYGEQPIQSRDDILMVLHGEVFERLAQIELLQQDRNRKTEEEQEIEAEAVAFFHNPRRFNIFGTGRNPDIAIIDIETQTIVGVVEAKTGFLNERAAKQMEDFGQSMQRVLDLAQRMQQEKGPEYFAYQHGLFEKVVNLKVAQNLRRAFIVPRGRGSTSETLLGEYKGAFYNEDLRQNLAQKIDSGEIAIIHSVFSNEEIGELSRVIAQKIEERIG